MLLCVLFLADWSGEADQDVLSQQRETQVSRIPQRMHSTCAASLTPMPCLLFKCHRENKVLILRSGEFVCADQDETPRTGNMDAGVDA